MTLNEIPGTIVVDLDVHKDERGQFVEILRSKNYPGVFVQANHSRSKAGVLRGLHYHSHQADLWYVVSGRAQVGLADLRARSGVPKTATLTLDGKDARSLYIPPGIAHGFLALTDVDLIYWVTKEYDASDEHGVAWNDPTLAIDWVVEKPILSPRDMSNDDLRWDNIPAFL
jgi:dTDP-4-dehydrorhamnose 3,5-epimerase